MHTLYMIYDENSKVTDFVIDNVSATQNFISLDRGPLSYVQSIVDNLNAYIKKNGSLTVDNAYIGQIRHGQFDETYGAIEDKRTDDSNYTFKSSTTSSSAASSSSAPASSSASSAASSAASQASEASSSAATPASSAASSAATPSK